MEKENKLVLFMHCNNIKKLFSIQTLNSLAQSGLVRVLAHILPPSSEKFLSAFTTKVKMRFCLNNNRFLEYCRITESMDCNINDINVCSFYHNSAPITTVPESLDTRFSVS